MKIIPWLRLISFFLGPFSITILNFGEAGWGRPPHQKYVDGGDFEFDFQISLIGGSLPIPPTLKETLKSTNKFFRDGLIFSPFLKNHPNPYTLGVSSQNIGIPRP